MRRPRSAFGAQPSAGCRWRSAGTISPQGLIVSGLTPTWGAASGPAKPDPRRLLDAVRLSHAVRVAPGTAEN